MDIDYLIVSPDVRPLRVPDKALLLARALHARNVRTAIVTLDPALESLPGIPVFLLSYRERVARGERWGDEIARGYGIKNFRRFAACELGYQVEALLPQSEEVLIAGIGPCCAEVHRLFSEHRILCVVHPIPGGEIFRRAISTIAAAHKIPTIYDAGVRYFPDRILLTVNDQWALAGRPRARFAGLPESKKRYLTDFMAAARQQQPVLTYDSPDRRFRALAARFMAEKKFREGRRIRRALVTTGTFARHVLSRRWRRPADLQRRYVYFPWQSTTESVLVIGTPKFFRLDYIAEYMARLLPAGVELYIKEHPHRTAEGATWDQLRFLAGLPQTRLVAPRTNSWTLSAHAEAVVTVNGTVGFEALLLGRPVIVLGRPPYAGWGITRDVADLNDLPQALDDVLGTKLDEEQILDFLASFEQVHHEGCWHGAGLEPDKMAAAILAAHRELAGTDRRVR